MHSPNHSWGKTVAWVPQIIHTNAMVLMTVPTMKNGGAVPSGIKCEKMLPEVPDTQET